MMSLFPKSRCLRRHFRRNRAVILILCCLTSWIMLLSDPYELASISVLPPEMGMGIPRNISSVTSSPAPVLVSPQQMSVLSKQTSLGPEAAKLQDASNANREEKESKRGVWPVGDFQEVEDRITAQLQYGFDMRDLYAKPNNASLDQLIFIATSGLGINNKDVTGRRKFFLHECPVNACFVFQGNPPGGVTKVDALVAKAGFPVRNQSNRDQVYVYYGLESPLHSRAVSYEKANVNWTATYRRDSTMVTPYEKFVHFDNFTSLPDKPTRNYALNKTKVVAWFVSNCRDKNGRLAYARELAKHINVDVYGGCGSLVCKRRDSKDCFTKLKRDYKFYLSFENSNCRDYITEKLYWNALNNDVVPVVMGAHPDDYRAVAPPHSYIHVDDFESPRHLAEYLHTLDQNDDLYNQYFRWKGTGTFIDTKFWCRLCAMLHARKKENYVHWYPDLVKWWSGPGTCVNPELRQRWASWRKDTTYLRSDAGGNASVNAKPGEEY